MVAEPHVKSLLELGDRVEVRGVFSRSEAQRQAFAARHGVPAARSIDELLADPGLDAILLLTPPNARREIVAAAAAAGKHILSEKPVERGTAAALEIVEICERAGVTLGVVFQHRFRLASQALKRLVDSNELGRMAIVQVSVPWWRPQSYYDQPGRGSFARDGGGVLITQAIHTLDLMLSVTGPVSEVAAVSGTSFLHRMEGEDFVGAGLRFANGAMGVLTATTAAYPGGEESIVIGFERGEARLSGGTLRVTRMDGTVSETGEPSGTGGGADPMAFPHLWHRDGIADFVAAIVEKRQPLVSGREALKVHGLIDALHVSATRRQAITIT